MREVFKFRFAALNLRIGFHILLLLHRLKDLGYYVMDQL
jgi:hypothetical protein